MGVRVLELRAGGAVLSNSANAWAFGPIFASDDDARKFLTWLRVDPRLLGERELERRYYEWVDHCHAGEYEKEG